MALKLGKTYRTRGGWTAKVVAVNVDIQTVGVGCNLHSGAFGSNAAAIHDFPVTQKDRTAPTLVCHDSSGRATPVALFGLGIPIPETYRNLPHPCDLVDEIPKAKKIGRVHHASRRRPARRRA